MAETRILAVSYLGDHSLRNITHVWTAGGAVSVRQALDEVWRRRSAFYVLTPGGHIPVRALPARGPSALQRLLGVHVEGTLVAAPTAGSLDALLGLPKLPSPNRGRRSEQRVAKGGQVTPQRVARPVPRHGAPTSPA